jgi:hypothetical protein
MGIDGMFFLAHFLGRIGDGITGRAMWPCCVQAVAAVMVLWFKLSCWCFGPKKKTWKDCL